MVVRQETAQTLTTGDAVVDWRLTAKRENQHVAQTLMMPFFVIMRHELANPFVSSERWAGTRGT